MFASRVIQAATLIWRVLPNVKSAIVDPTKARAVRNHVYLVQRAHTNRTQGPLHVPPVSQVNIKMQRAVLGVKVAPLATSVKRQVLKYVADVVLGHTPRQREPLVVPPVNKVSTKIKREPLSARCAPMVDTRI